MQLRHSPLPRHMDIQHSQTNFRSLLLEKNIKTSNFIVVLLELYTVSGGYIQIY